MGYKIFEFNMPTDFVESDLQKKIKAQLSTDDFSFHIDLKSLDSRNCKNIHWKVRVVVFSDSIQGENFDEKKLEIPPTPRKSKIIVVGSGPAGFFAAYVLLLAGNDVSIIERGSEVGKRSVLISDFEKGGTFSESGNYAFGEGGAGTFSDGKLTSRTKNINLEKQFVIDTYVLGGAPSEIAYLSHPHIGTNNLIKVVRNLRNKFLSLGGKILFDCTLIDVFFSESINVESIETNLGKLDCDYLLLAMGHSSYDTYRMLINRGIMFRTKQFAIGSRAEHSQELINTAQWGKPLIKGLKSAEYKLTFSSDDNLPVYSFCMCPGGKVVPASPKKDLSIVNGMSYYARNSKWANAAIVAGLNLNEFLRREVSPLEALDWLEDIEHSFFSIKNSFDLPAVKISDFLAGRMTKKFEDSSYPFELFSYDFAELFPKEIIYSLKKALKDFGNKIRGFENGVLMGLESKTSSPIQAVRDEYSRAYGSDNLFIIGEGSGHSGGIVSSAVDGIKAAFNLLRLL